MTVPVNEQRLLQLGSYLRARGYRFTSVTPDTHAVVCSRSSSASLSLRDVFGWNRSFEPANLPSELFEAMLEASVCAELGDGTYRASVRFATLDGQLFAHSGFPTDAIDSVFFGPDSYRFVRAVLPHLPREGRLVDVGCGSGVGGIMAARSAPSLQVVLSDINQGALAMARVNAMLAGVDVEVIKSDVLNDIEGRVDAVISNPPYLNDPPHRSYRDGGGAYGGALTARIVSEALERLSRDGSRGRLLVYSGAAITAADDALLRTLEPILHAHEAEYRYEEIDPDVFGTELLSPGYADVERIAAVFLNATIVSGRADRRA
jgi:methylase of polypeptide subunit release factors